MHAVHDAAPVSDELEYFPGSHSLHSDADVPDHVPTGQAVHEAALALEKVPPSHLVQSLLALPEYFPPSQDRHTVAPVAPAAVPGSQSSHSVAPVRGCFRPAEHSTQVERRLSEPYVPAVPGKGVGVGLCQGVPGLKRDSAVLSVVNRCSVSPSVLTVGALGVASAAEGA